MKVWLALYYSSDDYSNVAEGVPPTLRGDLHDSQQIDVENFVFVAHFDIEATEEMALGPWLYEPEHDEMDDEVGMAVGRMGVGVEDIDRLAAVSNPTGYILRLSTREPPNHIDLDELERPY